MPDPIPPDISFSSERQLTNPDGLYTQSHRLLFESPNKTQLEILSKVDPRVTYFRYRVPDLPSGYLLSASGEYSPKYMISSEPTAIFPVPDIQLEGWDAGYRGGIPVVMFDKELVVPHLEEYLAKKYKSKKIAVRGTACTVKTGECVIGGKIISNPVQILQVGIERNSKSYAPMIGFDTDSPKIPYRSLQWLTQHPEELRDKARKEGRNDLAASIFPILLVYDRTKFPADSTTLPNDPAERAKCILEGIVLDYPLSKGEFRAQ